MNGPGLIDYIYQKTNKINNEIILKNCIDPIFIIPVVFRIVTQENFLINRYDNLLIKGGRNLAKTSQVIVWT